MATTAPTRPVRTAPRQTPTRQTPVAARERSSATSAVKPFNMPFDAKNIRIILLGVVIIALGYFLMYVSPVMSDMALTVSPIILLIGYCIVVPMGIMAGSKTFRSTAPATEPPAAS